MNYECVLIMNLRHLLLEVQSNAEITYAELCLDNSGNTSGGWSTSTVDRKRRRSPHEEQPPPGSSAVIYATIDHSSINRSRVNGGPPSHHHHLPPHQREIVSVRTPLLVNSQQESCV